MQGRGSTLTLKPWADVTRSPKQGYQWPLKKDWCLPIFFLKKSCDCLTGNADWWLQGAGGLCSSLHDEACAEGSRGVCRSWYFRPKQVEQQVCAETVFVCSRISLQNPYFSCHLFCHRTDLALKMEVYLFNWKNNVIFEVLLNFFFIGK